MNSMQKGEPAIHKVKDKIVPVLEEAPCHENVWESGSKATHNLSLGIR
jgi:hypothetical protein